MKDVYKYSFVTIAADSASNSHEGFLHTRDAAFVEPLIELPHTDESGGRVAPYS